MLSLEAPPKSFSCSWARSQASNSLKVHQEEIADPKSTLIRAGEDRVRMVKEMVSRVQITLKVFGNVAEKYAVLRSGPRRKHMWVYFKWWVDFSSIDGLRSKVFICLACRILLDVLLPPRLADLAG